MRLRHLLPLALLLPSLAAAMDRGELTILSYHEIADKKDALTPAYAVSPTMFLRQMDWLRNHGVSGSISLAYPYGLTTATVTARAAATGYSAGLLVEGGWFTGATGTNWDVPRYNVPAGLSTDGFRLRLSGYWVRHNGGAS